jgi:hypothetical protein
LRLVGIDLAEEDRIDQGSGSRLSPEKGIPLPWEIFYIKKKSTERAADIVTFESIR